MEHKCKFCGEKAYYIEKSPGYDPYYFCSIEHHLAYLKKVSYSYRALPLERIDGRWSASMGLPFDRYKEDEKIKLKTR